MEKYANIEFGIKISVPDGWEVLPAAWTKNMRMKSAPTSEELAELLAKAQTPFLYLQHPQSNPYLPTPTVQFVAKPKNTLISIGGMEKLLDATHNQLQIAFPDFECLARHDQMIVAGLKCGYLKSSMSVRNEHNVNFDCLSELYVFESMRALFIMGMSASIQEVHYPVDAFKSILRSIEFF